MEFFQANLQHLLLNTPRAIMPLYINLVTGSHSFWTSWIQFSIDMAITLYQHFLQNVWLISSVDICIWGLRLTNTKGVNYYVKFTWSILRMKSMNWFSFESMSWAPSMNWFSFESMPWAPSGGKYSNTQIIYCISEHASYIRFYNEFWGAIINHHERWAYSSMNFEHAHSVNSMSRTCHELCSKISLKCTW